MMGNLARPDIQAPLIEPSADAWLAAGLMAIVGIVLLVVLVIVGRD